MKNPFQIIIFIILAFLLGYFLNNQITGQFVTVATPAELDTCLYQTRTGINVLPNQEICCDTIKRFFKCDNLQDTEIIYGQYSTFINRQCYNNINGELKIFFRDDLENFCRNEGYI